MKRYLVAALLVLSSSAHAADLNKMIGVRLKDIMNYVKDNGIPGLNSKVVANLDETGARLSGTSVSRNSGTYLQAAPQVSGSSATLELATVLTGRSGSVIVKYTADIYGNGSSINTRNARIITGSQMKFNMLVGLVDRKVIMNDSVNGLKLVFPNGVGSFDRGVLNPGVTTLLTPRFESAKLTADATISQRAKPRYFANKPFIRIVDGHTNEYTAIGFHTEINDSFYRGFDSHGCMRLRDNDLYMLHDLVKYGQTTIPIKVAYRVNDPADHPAPKVNKVIKEVLNAGTKEDPQMKLDVDDLVQTVYREIQAPVDELKDEAGDHYKEMYQYEAMETYAKQRAEQKEKCDAMLANGSLKQSQYESCTKQGARKLTTKQKLYRWWVH